jgi:hypothetical protein
MQVQFCDEFAAGFGWIAAEPAHMRRASHALVDGDDVWLVDPVTSDDVVRRVSESGRAAGVIELLDRHGRDGATLAARFGVPLHRVPAAVPGSPFRVLEVVRLPRWREVALWWPEQHTLVVADALGTASYFVAPGEALAVHPLLRLWPPRALASLAPEHVLCGHGEGVHGPETPALVREAISTARRRTPAWLGGLVRRR